MTNSSGCLASLSCLLSLLSPRVEPRGLGEELGEGRKPDGGSKMKGSRPWSRGSGRGEVRERRESV